VKGRICQANILEMNQELQTKKLYDKEESEVARFCLACLCVGAKKTNVRMLSEPINPRKFHIYWNNLKTNHYFNKDKTIDIEELETDLPFLLMMKCAEGFLERKEAVK